MRFLASWKMIAFELFLGALGGGLLPSHAADAPTTHLVAELLIILVIILMGVTLIATLVVYKQDKISR